MKTDALVYALFKEAPECYFEAIGADPALAKSYAVTAPELKTGSRRIDCVFVPTQPECPLHFVEVYFYSKPEVYDNLLVKVFMWRETHFERRDWRATVFFENKKLEPAYLLPYRELLDSGRLTRVYLDERPEPQANQIGLTIMSMIVSPPQRAAATARKVLGRIRRSSKSTADQERLIELVETILIGHFPKLSRKELAAMLKIKDFRETRVYQEGREEGRETGLQQAREEIALRLIQNRLADAEIAALTGLTLRQVQKLRRSNERPANGSATSKD